jgi:hypothetical protein
MATPYDCTLWQGTRSAYSIALCLVSHDADFAETRWPVVVRALILVIELAERFLVVYHAIRGLQRAGYERVPINNALIVVTALPLLSRRTIHGHKVDGIPDLAVHHALGEADDGRHASAHNR